MTAPLAGAVVRVQGELRFLSAQAVRRFVPAPQLSDVAGTGLIMALVDGQVLAVIALGARGTTLAVCEVGGELVGLLGADPRAVGFFEADGSGVSFEGQPACALDVAELVRSAVRAGEQPEAVA